MTDCTRRQTTLGLGALLLAACRDRAERVVSPAPVASSASPEASAQAPVAAVSSGPASEPRPPGDPPEGDLDERWRGFAAEVAAIARTAIDGHEAPGVVVQVSHQGKVVLRAAHGWRCVEPTIEAMTADTVFDLASLTKAVATATVVHLLASDGALDPGAPLRARLPELGEHALGDATIEHLLLHTSGLASDLPVEVTRGGMPAMLAAVASRPLLAPPGQRSRYSDTGYQLLGEIVARTAGTSLARQFAARVAVPLGTATLTFTPPAALRERVAPTGPRHGGGFWRGEAHDPTARALGGVAGHAGLFGTADDLDRFGRMLLAGGVIEGRRVLPARVVGTLLAHRAVPSGTRTLGWDVSSGMVTGRGDVFPARGVGHSGFTGTSVWLDPPTRTAVTVLTSRLHPDDRGNVQELRRSLGTVTARRAMTSVRTGLDEAVAGHGNLRGRRVGLLTHAAAVDMTGRRSVDALRAAGVEVACLFSPEHGLAGTADGQVADGRDAATGLPVRSLYGKSVQPDADALAGLDALVIDLQDAGCRFYTYLATASQALAAAAARGLAVVVLDRPNPLGGEAIEGPLLDEGRKGTLVAYHRLPVRHGLTLGEALGLVAAERGVAVRLEVVKMTGWRRAMRWPETTLTWHAPSPNLRRFQAALLYPGVGLLELTNLSVGRGTDWPFEQLGAPWLDGVRVATDLARRKIPGLSVAANHFTPTSGPFSGQRCGGVALAVSNPAAFSPLQLGAALAVTLRQRHRDDWSPASLDVLLGHRASLDALLAGEDDAQLLARWQSGRDAFVERRSGHLLYT